MAIEDAEAVSLFGPEVGANDIPDILSKIDSICRPRTKVVSETTRQTAPNAKMTDRLERMSSSTITVVCIRSALSDLAVMTSREVLVKT